MENGEYIFYADESGDHSLVSVDPTFPVFVLAICAFRVRDYCHRVVPAFQQFKFRHFAHDMIILHEREIRKQIGDFALLADLSVREKFMNDLSATIALTPFRIFSVIIDKRELKSDLFPDNPYVLALRYCLEEIYRFLAVRHLEDQKHVFVFERRGHKEDLDLELEFRRITDGDNAFLVPFNGFRIRFADKRCNSTGMQLADLTARPIGLHHVRPQQSNRSFDIIETKLQSFKNTKRLQRGVFLAANRIKAKGPG